MLITLVLWDMRVVAISIVSLKQTQKQVSCLADLSKGLNVRILVGFASIVRLFFLITSLPLPLVKI